MADETNNKRLHLALGRCWHERSKIKDPKDRRRYIFVCSKCGDAALRVWKTDQPDYCSDLNLCAEAEKEVIERVGAFDYAEALCADLLGNEPGDFPHQTTLIRCLTATGEQRVAAMLAALEALGLTTEGE